MSDPKTANSPNSRPPIRQKAVPPEMDFEPVPLPDQAAEPGTKDADAPPARSGQTKKAGVADGKCRQDIPVHHNGRIERKGLAAAIASFPLSHADGSSVRTTIVQGTTRDVNSRRELVSGGISVQENERLSR
ncbi:hypothetical protein F2981_19150 (plasmid) [Sinorhizobium meliloti]|nr:hypothetical protein [Sinorhizobium meliloti]